MIPAVLIAFETCSGPTAKNRICRAPHARSHVVWRACYVLLSATWYTCWFRGSRFRCCSAWRFCEQRCGLRRITKSMPSTPALIPCPRNHFFHHTPSNPLPPKSMVPPNRVLRSALSKRKLSWFANPRQAAPRCAVGAGSMPRVALQGASRHCQ